MSYLIPSFLSSAFSAFGKSSLSSLKLHGFYKIEASVMKELKLNFYDKVQC